MRTRRSRQTDGTFDLNLAPFLDIIVSIIPMLLLSVVFVQIKMIETSIPQVVAKQIEQNRKDKMPKVNIVMKASKDKGYQIVLDERGKKRTIAVQAKSGKLDYDKLTASLATVKRKYTDIFSMDFAPSKDIAYEEIVATMDAVRKLPKGEKVAFLDKSTGKSVETNLMFPDVTFSNVLGN